MLVRIWLLLLATAIAAASVTNHAQGLSDERFDHCTASSADAPYGLEITRYAEIKTSVETQFHALLEAGCSLVDLTSLASCDVPDMKELIRLIDSLNSGCSSELSATIKNTHRFLLEHGCLETGPRLDQSNTVKTASMLLQQQFAYSDLTTCFAISMSARRALTDSFLQEPQTAQALARPQNVPAVSTTTDSEADSGRSAKQEVSSSPSLWVALLAGALAGLAIDLSLFPLDTIKTRLQSTSGFREAGGFHGLYQGIGSIALGSAPSSALFFLAYTVAGKRIAEHIGQTFLGHLIATTIGELASSVVRVPADVVKSRQQVEQLDGSVKPASLWTAIAKVYEEGKRPNSRSHFGVFYSGWLSTMVREIPFGCIQFPLFSYLKSIASQGEIGQLSMLRTALCGTIAGSFAGLSTTPLDVIRTRIILADSGAAGIFTNLKIILRQDGIGGLFKGALPRTLWIGAGGAIFLGGYDGFVRAIESLR